MASILIDFHARPRLGARCAPDGVGVSLGFVTVLFLKKGAIELVLLACACLRRDEK